MVTGAGVQLTYLGKAPGHGSAGPSAAKVVLAVFGSVAVLASLACVGWVAAVHPGIDPDRPTCVKPMTTIKVTTEARTRPHEWSLPEIALSPDGRTMATAGQPIQIWDITTGRQTGELAHRFKTVDMMEFSPDGKRLALAASDTQVRDFVGAEPTGPGAAGTGSLYPVSLLVVGTDSPGHVLPHVDAVDKLRFSPDGETIVTASRGRPVVTLWAPNGRGGVTSKPLAGNSPYATDVEFSPDGKTVAVVSSTGTVRLWDWAKGQVVKTIEGNTSGNNPDLEFSPDGARVAVLTDEGPIQIWDLTTGERVLSIAVPKTHGDLTFTPNGAVAVEDWQRTIHTWEAVNGRELQKLLRCFPAGRDGVAGFDPLGRHLTETFVTRDGERAVSVWPVPA